MARIVLGMAVPHSGMLRRAPENWLEDGERDRKNTALWYRNRSWTFPELAAERKNDGFQALLALAERQQRSQRCARALETLSRIYRDNKPDVAIIIGKDQKEIFIDHSPSIAVYTGDTIHNGPPQRAVYAPPEPITYPGCPDLALHLVQHLQADGFDLTDLFKWPPNVWMKDQAPIVPHAYGFVYRQIMQDQAPPTVPVIMNTFYPPTQPSFKRSLEFGKSLYEAIKAWDTDKTIAIIASGGLSHFVCDEQLDQLFISSFQSYDFERLMKVDDRSYQSGTSEVKLYVSVLWAMSQLGWKMNLVDYVPCYRTEAGTGEGFGFMTWTPS
jgi:Catalytic LigB subunit of aromatic ring-opening dioxygenase